MTHLGTVAKTVQEGSLYVMLLMLPFAPAAIESMFGVLLFGWLAQRLDPHTRAETLWTGPRLRGLLMAVVAYLFICGVSIAVSDYPQKSIQGFINKWLEYLLLFGMAADVASRPHVIERCGKVIAWSAALVILEAVSQEFLGKGLFRGHRLTAYGRMTGPYTNPIDLATYLMVAIPLLFSVVLTWRGWRRVAGSALIVGLMMCLGRTAAIGAWMGLCVGLAGMVFASRAMRRLGAVSLIILMVGGVTWFQYVGRLDRQFLPTDIGPSDRWVMWQAAVGMIKDRPVLGHGLNTFMANYLTYWVGGERQPRYAHNCYLQVAAETGITGLVTFLVLLGVLFWRLIARVRRLAGHPQILLWGFCVGLLAFITQAAVDTNFYSLRQAALFWVVAGLALGLSERDVSHASPTL